MSIDKGVKNRIKHDIFSNSPYSSSPSGIKTVNKFIPIRIVPNIPIIENTPTQTGIVSVIF